MKPYVKIFKDFTQKDSPTMWFGGRQRGDIIKSCPRVRKLWIWLCRHMRWNWLSCVDWGTSRHVKRALNGSEDPRRRKWNLFCSYILKALMIKSYLIDVCKYQTNKNKCSQLIICYVMEIKYVKVWTIWGQYGNALWIIINIMCAWCKCLMCICIYGTFWIVFLL